MFLNLRITKESEKSEPNNIKVGSVRVTQVLSTKMLGITIDENQEWRPQISGQGGIVASLNSRLFLIRRLSNYISKTRLKRVADSLYTSKIRYGIQLMGVVNLLSKD